MSNGHSSGSLIDLAHKSSWSSGGTLFSLEHIPAGVGRSS